MQTNYEFFSDILNDVTNFSDGRSLSIVECVRHSDNKRVFCLAATRVNPVSQELEFQLLAVLFEKNPFMEMDLVQSPVHASQKSMEDWAKEAEMTVANIKELN